jgi:hypothetical protein
MSCASEDDDVVRSGHFACVRWDKIVQAEAPSRPITRAENAEKCLRVLNDRPSSDGYCLHSSNKCPSSSACNCRESLVLPGTPDQYRTGLSTRRVDRN